MHATALYAVARWVVIIGWIVAVAAADEVIETVREGTSVTLTAEFDPAVGPFYYQWSKDGVILPDEQESTVRFASVQMSDAGAYIAYVTNEGGTANSEPAMLRVSALNPSRVSNFSLIAAGSPLIVGFGLAGESDRATPFLIRAAGPALEQFGVETFMRDPKLQVFNSGTAVADNDNWLDSPNLSAARSAVTAFAFATGSLDSALLLNVGAKSYTAQVSESGGAHRSALLELFDLTSTAASETPRVVAISARAIGPGVAHFGLTSPLEDPTLSLLRDKTVIAANDDWTEGNVVTLADADRQVGAIALAPGSRDAALVALLAPGSYTLRLGGVSSLGGTALLELYDVP